MVVDGDYLGESGQRLHMTVDVPMSAMAKQQVVQQTRRFLRRYAGMFRFASVYTHIKQEHRRVVCSLRVATDRGLYVASVFAWETQDAVAEAVRSMDTQLRRSLSRVSSRN